MSVITIDTTINANIDQVWEYWTVAEHVIQWNTALETWHTPHAENDLNIGGKFNYRMEAKDGSMGFDFWGIYNNIIQNELIETTLGDGRKVSTRFSSDKTITRVIESFETESQNPEEMQRAGWQAILDNFKKYVESH